VKLSKALASATLAAMTVGLAGCISVFPKATPAQLYDFGRTFPSQHAPNTGAPTFNVARSLTAFTRPALGDKILTTNGNQVAYIAGSRWVSPAALLFDEAEERAFDADDGPARLMRRGEMSGAVAELKLEVQTFEARYPGDLKAAPTVVIEVRATLTAANDRHIIDQKTFTSKQPIGDNRVGEIVRGFDAGSVEVLSQIASWTDAEAGAITQGQP
jgi:cholesterol transport system auxiliary component